MTDIERKINVKMLEDVYEWQLTGKMPSAVEAGIPTYTTTVPL